MSLSEILEKAKGSLIISDAFTKADSILNYKGYKNIACSVSGGADSDILIDIFDDADALDMAIKALEQTSPCDLYRYNPPSSGDGKPCSVYNGGDEE